MTPYGHNGKILRVDLSTRTMTEEQSPEILYRRYLGGGALSLYYLLNELAPGIEPLGSENLLIFAASAVTGTPGPGFSRFTVTAKSPITGAFGESEAGGWWGPELKFSGFDAIITLTALGSLCGIGDLKAIALANQICGPYSIDTISTGTTIAFAMECFERGIITTKDTGGIKLEFGSAEAMLQMVELIGKREGFGDILADGVKAAAEKIGKQAEQYAMHVKGLPLPLHEPRGKTGLALAYALSPTGADHLEAPHDPFFESEGGLKSIKPLGIIEPLPTLDMTQKGVSP